MHAPCGDSRTRRAIVMLLVREGQAGAPVWSSWKLDASEVDELHQRALGKIGRIVE